MNIQTKSSAAVAKAPLIAAILAISLAGIGLSLTLPLIAMRLEAAGFSAQTNGASTALAGLAMILSAPLTPRLVRAMGARALLIAALLLAVAALLAFACIDNLYLWFPIRLAYGCSISVLFVVSEYAINSMAPPARRGLWVGVYSASLAVGFAAGPALLGIVGIEGRAPFFWAIALFCLAGAPIAAMGGQIPGFCGHTDASPLVLLRREPILMLAAILFGVVETTGMGLLPVYVLRNGGDAAAGAHLVSIAALGAVAFQIPVGLLSDHISRLRLIAAVAFCGLVGALCLAWVGGESHLFAPILFIWSGLVGGLYMVGLAELGARYNGANLAAANSTFIMFYALGMSAGPPSLGLALDFSPRYGLFATLALLFAAYLSLIYKKFKQFYISKQKIFYNKI